MSATTILRSVLALGSLLAVSASAQVWIESGDAPSFPDGPAQITRRAALDTISGSTGAGDLRDAYCIRIVQPGRFVATTDPATSPTANADFDTRLFLFRADGAPVLANDDTPPGQPPYLSTLTGTATDGSGFVLSQPGDYVLVVAGSPEDPQDPTDLNLFNIDSALDGVHAPDSSAGRFDEWEGEAPGIGSYEVFLAGVTPCQNNLDAVFGNSKENRVCLVGNSTCSDVSPDTIFTADVALGFVDGDPYLDAVFANITDYRNRLCLGDGLGGFTCSDVSSLEYSTGGLALGFVDGDPYLDAVFANGFPGGSGGMTDRVCLGNGLGGFTCSDVSPYTHWTVDVALGYMDGDPHLDAVFGNTGKNQVCLGDGLGDFTCTDISTGNSWTHVALGYVDGDQNLDAVFANYLDYGLGERNRLCLGDGLGGFTCSDVSTDTNRSYGVALGFVDGDPHLDAVFANGDGERSRVCLGDGLGGFACSDVSTDSNSARSVALGFLDGDPYLDAVFATYSSNRLCLGDGLGGFSCSDVSNDENRTADVALGEVVLPPAIWRLACFSFDNLCGGIEIRSVRPDNTVIGTWRNWDCAGGTSPMLGGYSGEDSSPRRSWLASDRDAILDVYSFNLNVSARTFDLFLHDTAGNLTKMYADEPYTKTAGACPFLPEPWIDGNFDGDVEVLWRSDGHSGCGPDKDEDCWSWRIQGADTKGFEWSKGFRDGPMQCDNTGIGNSFVLGTKPHEDYMTAEIINIGGVHQNVLELKLFDDDRDSQFKSRMEYSCNNWDGDFAMWNEGGYLAMDVWYPPDQHDQSCRTPGGGCWRIMGEVYAINEGDPDATARMTYGMYKQATGEPWHFNIGSVSVGLDAIEKIWSYISEEPVSVGEWFRYEYQFTPDSAIGAEDGTVKVWINGVLIFDVVGTTWVGKKTWDMFAVYTNSNRDPDGNLSPSVQRIDNLKICQTRACMEDS